MVHAVDGGGALLEALARNVIDPGRRPFDLVICNQALTGISGLSVLAGWRIYDRATGFILIADDAAVRARAERLDAVLITGPLTVEGIRHAILRTGLLPSGPPAARSVA